MTDAQGHNTIFPCFIHHSEYSQSWRHLTGKLYFCLSTFRVSSEFPYKDPITCKPDPKELKLLSVKWRLGEILDISACQWLDAWLLRGFYLWYSLLLASVSITLLNFEIGFCNSLSYFALFTIWLKASEQWRIWLERLLVCTRGIPMGKKMLRLYSAKQLKLHTSFALVKSNMHYFRLGFLYPLYVFYRGTVYLAQKIQADTQSRKWKLLSSESHHIPHKKKE